VLERDGGACVICGSDSRPAVHHIVPHRRTGRDRIDELITVCAKCHPFVERSQYRLIEWDQAYCARLIQRLHAYHAALTVIGWRLVLVRTVRRNKTWVVYKPIRQADGMHLYFCTPGLHFLTAVEVSEHEEAPVEKVPPECYLPVTKR